MTDKLTKEPTENTTAAGWPVLAGSDFHVPINPRIQGWGHGLRSRINSRPPETASDYAADVARMSRPIVSHEVGQWCVYPNFAETNKYSGVLRARNFEIFSDFLDDKGMLHQAEDFLMASGALQLLCYKEDIESALRTKGFGGFQLLDLHDFPGQGTALVGVLDPFWDPKPYVTAEQYRRFCDATVPLARMEKRYWSDSEIFAAEIEYSNFGPEPIGNAGTLWWVVDEQGQTLLRGELGARDLPIDNGIGVGRIEFDCAELPPANKYSLHVGIEGTDIENDWGFWVFPTELEPLDSERVEIATVLGPDQLEILAQGGKVLLMPPPRRVESDVAIGFSTVFWNTAWTGWQAPHTLGILCDPEHPVFERFPTDYHSDWQWWELIHGSAAMILDELPTELQPLVQPIDTWFSARKLGLLFEARVNGGKLMVCSMDLANDLEQRLAARQLRHSIIAYMESPEFDPQIELSGDQISSLFKEPSLLEALGTTAEADCQAPGYPAENAIDGDPRTIWHTAWEGEVSPMPKQLTVDLKRPVEIIGITVLPRQDLSNGRIADGRVLVSEDGAKWDIAARFSGWPDSGERREIDFDSKVKARYVRIVAEREVKGRTFASIAELDLLLESKQ